MSKIEIIPNSYLQDPSNRESIVTPYFDKFYVQHQRMMWHFDQIPFDRINPGLLIDDDIIAVRSAMLVESHNPVYTEVLLRVFRPDHEMTSFIIVWGYEEFKHYMGLRRYLKATGKVNLTELGRELEQTRAGEWGKREADFTPAQSYAYTTLQEQVTGMFYLKFAENVKEPVLQGMLRLIGKDEMRHCQYYLGKAQQEQKNNPQAKDEIDEVLLDFGMPGPTFIEGYPDYARVMNRVAKPGPAELAQVLKRVGEMVGYDHMLDLAERPDYKNILEEKWGMELEPVLRVIRPLRAAAKLLPFR